MKVTPVSASALAKRSIRRGVGVPTISVSMAATVGTLTDERSSWKYLGSQLSYVANTTTIYIFAAKSQESQVGEGLPSWAVN